MGSELRTALSFRRAGVVCDVRAERVSRHRSCNLRADSRESVDKYAEAVGRWYRERNQVDIEAFGA